MFFKKGKLVAAIVTAAVLVSTIDTPVFAAGFPTAGATPALEATAPEDQKSYDAPKADTLLAVGDVDSETLIINTNAPATEPYSFQYIAPSVDAADEETVEDTVSVVEEETVSQNDLEDFSNLVIAQVNDYVNVRDQASEEGEILGKLYNKSVGEFISEENGWYQIQSGSVTGFVKAEYVVTGEDAVALAKEVCTRIATVQTTTLFVREQPTTDSSVIGMVPIEDELTITEEGVDEGWIKVSIEEGEGYVSTEYVTLSTEFVKAESKAEEEARLAKEEAARKKANAAAGASKGSSKGAGSGSGSGAAGGVAGYALQFVGNPYVYGGSSLTNGTDCSGFTMSVYAHFGVSLPHSSSAQRSCGYDVGGLANAQPGDLVCYSGHVALYIGNGQIVHASTAATGIKVSNANYRQVLAVRRIF